MARRVAGMTCMTPRAPALETACGWCPDSTHASDRTSSGEIP
jgi:hypothetical protein